MEPSLLGSKAGDHDLHDLLSHGGSSGFEQGGRLSTAVERLAAALHDVVAEAVAAIAQPAKDAHLPRADLTAAELAKRYNRNAVSIRVWCAEGRFPHAYKLNGKEWRVPPADVLAYEIRERGRARFRDRSVDAEGLGDSVDATGLGGLGDWRRLPRGTLGRGKPPRGRGGAGS